MGHRLLGHGESTKSLMLAWISGQLQVTKSLFFIVPGQNALKNVWNVWHLKLLVYLSDIIFLLTVGKAKM